MYMNVIYKTFQRYTNQHVVQKKTCKNEILDSAAKRSLKVFKKLLKKNKFLKRNYTELAQLVQFYLSQYQPDIHIRHPGPVHHVCFMGQSIYFLKLKIMSKLINLPDV